MKLVKTALLYIKSRFLNSSLHIIMMAVGISLVIALMIFSAQIKERIIRDGSHIDVVIGAKGSPLQLVLSALYQIDIPTGNIPLSQAQKIMRHPQVKQATPISLGDNFHGFRIVGTDESYLDLYNAKIVSGKIWASPMEAVLGSKVALDSNLKIGDSFVGGHGLIPGGEEHEHNPYKVVGILAPTNSVIDRLVLTSLESVWDVHHHEEEEEHEEHHEKEVTALLVQYKSHTAILDFPRQINRESQMQAASAANEILRLIDMLGIGTDTLKFFAIFLIFAALLSIFISLISGLKERQYDIAIMRVLGASKRKIFLLVLIEGKIIALVGCLIGVALGHIAVSVISCLSSKGREIGLTGKTFLIEEIYLIIAVLLLAVLASLIPAFKAYKSDVVKILNS